MKQIYEYPTQELGKVPCECGATHTVDMPKIYYGEILPAIREVILAGHILVLMQEDVDDNILTPLLKTNVYRVSIGKIEPFGREYTEQIDDDVRVILAIGGDSVIEIAKRIAYVRNNRLVVLPLFAYKSSLHKDSLLIEDGEVHIERGVLPEIIIVDYAYLSLQPREYILGAYARILSSLSVATEYEYHSRLEGNTCKYLIKALRLAVVNIAREEIIDNTLSNKIADTLLRVEVLRMMIGDIQTGTEQLILTTYRYLEMNISDVRSFGENSMYCSYLVGQLYSSFLTRYTANIGLPPNRGTDAERIRRMLNCRESYYLVHARPYDKEINQSEYKLQRIKSQLLNAVTVNNMIMKVGIKNVFDNYQDKGYFMRDYLGVKEMMRLIQLAPDYVGGDTLLSFIKDTGVLEKM